jgi:hypothetical protein
MSIPGKTGGNMQRVANRIPPAALFQGYNAVTGAGKSTAVTGHRTPTGASTTARIHICSSIEEIASSLEIDQSLSASLEGMGGIDEKSTFFSSLKVTTSSLSIVVRVKRCVAAEQMTDVWFKDGLAPPSTREELMDFVAAYGDSFIAGISKGGEYIGLFTFFSDTKEEQTKVTADLSAHGIVDGISVSADICMKLSNFHSTTNTASTFNQFISGVGKQKLPDPKEFGQFALDFSALDLDQPTIVSAIGTGYEDVPGFRKAFSLVAVNRQYFTGGNGKPGLVSDLLTLKAIRNQMATIKAIYTTYGGYVDNSIEDNQIANSADINTVQEQFSAYERDPTQSFDHPPLSSLSKGSPSLQYDKGVAQWGNRGHVGGDHEFDFDDVGDIDAFIRKQYRVSFILLRGTDQVNHMEIKYESDAAYPAIVRVCGGGGGRNTEQCFIPTGSFISRISGKLINNGLNIETIEIVYDGYDSSDGSNKIQGGDGGGDITFDWYARGDNHPPYYVLGFFEHGWDDYVQVLGIYYLNFRDAKWHPLQNI